MTEISRRNFLVSAGMAGFAYMLNPFRVASGSVSQPDYLSIQPDKWTLELQSHAIGRDIPTSMWAKVCIPDARGIFAATDLEKIFKERAKVKCVLMGNELGRSFGADLILESYELHSDSALNVIFVSTGPVVIL